MSADPHVHGAACCETCGTELELRCPTNPAHEGVSIFRDPAHQARIAPAPTTPEAPRGYHSAAGLDRLREVGRRNGHRERSCSCGLVLRGNIAWGNHRKKCEHALRAS